MGLGVEVPGHFHRRPTPPPLSSLCAAHREGVALRQLLLPKGWAVQVERTCTTAAVVATKRAELRSTYPGGALRLTWVSSWWASCPSWGMHPFEESSGSLATAFVFPPVGVTSAIRQHKMLDVVVELMLVMSCPRLAPRGFTTFLKASSSRLGGWKCLFSYGVNQAEGVESFWDAQDHHLARRRMRSVISPYDVNCLEAMPDHDHHLARRRMRSVISPYDVNCLEAMPDHVIMDTIAREWSPFESLIITLALIFAECGESYKESLNVFEAAEKRSTTEIAQLKEEVETGAMVDPSAEEPMLDADGDERVDILGHDDGVAGVTEDGTAPSASPTE
ncbi:hypothetical protein Pfo_010096 [Paulownia fortunei]|nr:hypothetical protein Pfo_010096 [Paulownia fortunei]